VTALFKSPKFGRRYYIKHFGLFFSGHAAYAVYSTIRRNTLQWRSKDFVHTHIKRLPSLLQSTLKTHLVHKLFPSSHRWLLVPQRPNFTNFLFLGRPTIVGMTYILPLSFIFCRTSNLPDTEQPDKSISEVGFLPRPSMKN